MGIEDTVSGKKKALKIAEMVSAKHAERVVILDLKGTSGLCDYFVICSGDSTTQVKAIAAGTQKACKKNKISIRSLEKDSSASWILVDLFDVILHIFLEEARAFYNLEYLWKESKKIKFSLR